MIYGSMEREISGFTKIKDIIKGRKGGVMVEKRSYECVSSGKKYVLIPQNLIGEGMIRRRKMQVAKLQKLEFSFFFLFFLLFPFSPFLSVPGWHEAL